MWRVRYLATQPVLLTGGREMLYIPPPTFHEGSAQSQRMADLILPRRAAFWNLLMGRGPGHLLQLSVF